MAKNQEGTEGESFGDILAAFEREKSETKQAPSRKQASSARRGTVAGMSGDFVLVDFGAKSEGVISVADLTDAEGKLTVQRGDTFDVAVTGRNNEGLVTLSRVTGPRPRDWQGLQQAFEGKHTIAGRVTGLTKGGFTVDVGTRAFMPSSRSGVREAAEMEKLVGQEVRCRVIEFDPEDENVVVDRRSVLEEEARTARQTTMASLQEGAVVRGVVRTLMDFGAFVDLGGVDGLLHVGDISWSRVADPRKELSVGDPLDLKVLKVDRDTGKISLGLKQLYPDPWEEAGKDLKTGDRVRGQVTKLADFGAFVEVRPGVEGLIHVSEMSWTKRVNKPSEVLTKGEFVEAVVLKVDIAARRLSLGLKQVIGNPWDSIAQRYPVGTMVEGKVTRLAKFGAFVELEEGIDGLIHISELSAERRVEHPSEVVKIGKTVKAVVLSADPEARRLKLGMKQLEATSLDGFLAEHKAGDKVTGRVSRIKGSTATIQLGEGVEGTCESAVASVGSGTMASALASAWKGAATLAPAREPLKEGQLHTFVIRSLGKEGIKLDCN